MNKYLLTVSKCLLDSIELIELNILKLIIFFSQCRKERERERERASEQERESERERERERELSTGVDARSRGLTRLDTILTSDLRSRPYR